MHPHTYTICKQIASTESIFKRVKSKFVQSLEYCYLTPIIGCILCHNNPCVLFNVKSYIYIFFFQANFVKDYGTLFTLLNFIFSRLLVIFLLSGKGIVPYLLSGKGIVPYLLAKQKVTRNIEKIKLKINGVPSSFTKLIWIITCYLNIHSFIYT